MCQKTIFDLNHFCYYLFLKQIKLNGKEGNVAYLLDDVEYVAFEIW